MSNRLKVPLKANIFFLRKKKYKRWIDQGGLRRGAELGLELAALCEYSLFQLLDLKSRSIRLLFFNKPNPSDLPQVSKL